tara:strand:+ start:9045 stop:9599 length:555 start_codon:yes stop_codon:yes gene_type:complete
VSTCNYCGRYFVYPTDHFPTSHVDAFAGTYCSLQCKSQGEGHQQNEKKENAEVFFMIVAGVISLIAFVLPLIIKGGSMLFSWIQVQLSGTQSNSFVSQQTQETDDLEINIVDESEPVSFPSTTPPHSQPRKNRPKQLPPALPKSFSSTKHKSKSSPPPIPKTIRSKAEPPPLPMDISQKKPRSQ